MKVRNCRGDMFTSIYIIYNIYVYTCMYIYRYIPMSKQAKNH